MYKKYSEVYDVDFLDSFGNNANKIKNINFDGEYIDVDKITKACNIDLKYDKMKHSGISKRKSNIDKNIVINKSEPRYRQRFTIAHEIGHIILEHKVGRKVYRTEDLKKYRNIIDKAEEVSANKFAADLLMPKKLVVEVLKTSLIELGYSMDQKLYKDDIDDLVKLSAEKLDVSYLAFKYRLKNLGILNEYLW